MKIQLPRSTIILSLGLIVWIFSIVNYFLFGYILFCFAGWLLGMLLVSLHFVKPNLPAFDFKSTYPIIFLILIFTPFYFFSLYTIPFQMNTDELVIMSFNKIAIQPGNDLMGINRLLFSMPSLIFAFYGGAAQLLGGITLYNTRLVHAVFGLLIILISFLFFRLRLNIKYSLGASLILGFNHALMGISRMAMRDNSGLFVEILALFLLLKGLQNKSKVLIFLGGISLGLSLYVYFVARIVLLIWALFLVLYFFKNKMAKKEFFKLTLISSLGFIMMAAPVLISTFKQPSADFHYQREQILLFEEGRKMQQSWIGAPTIEAGLKQNFINSLTVFNNTKSDYAYIYPNIGHGFADPLTGFLVWIGFFIVLIKKHKQEIDLLALIGLATSILTFGLIINKAPDYTRLLVTLPFVAYFCIQAIKFGIRMISRLTGLRNRLAISLKTVFYISIIFTIVILNISIFADFTLKGLNQGDNVGSTFRYVDARKDIPNYTFYISAGSEYPYYSWGDKITWITWLGFPISKNQKVEYIDPVALDNTSYSKPFTIFLNSSLFKMNEEYLTKIYPNLRIHNILTNGSLIAIEVN